MRLWGCQTDQRKAGNQRDLLDLKHLQIYLIHTIHRDQGERRRRKEDKMVVEGDNRIGLMALRVVMGLINLKMITMILFHSKV